jgi:hypothetical protein
MAEQPGQIHGLISKIMDEVGYIPKGGRNKEQNYAFRSIDQIYAVMQPILAKHGVYIAPEVLEHTRQERPTRNGGIMAFTILKVRFTVTAPDGSCIEIVTIGEGMDTSDKSANKAMSAACKYAATTLFWIPTDDPKDSENDHVEPAASQPDPKPAASSQPPSASVAMSSADVVKAFVDRGIGKTAAMGTIKSALGAVGKKTLAEAGPEWTVTLLNDLKDGRFDNLKAKK